jgi:hypothetical protein
MNGLISRLGWDFQRAFDAELRIEYTMLSPMGHHFVDACSGRRPLVLRQLPVSAMVRPEASVWQTQPDQLMVTRQPPIKVAQTIERLKLSGIH